VSKQDVTPLRTSKASHNRRKQEAKYASPMPGCESTFTRRINLNGHLRAHSDERPFVCRWPECGRAFPRQHDCKRHKQLHTNYPSFVCGGGESGAGGCGKKFARMDALNRHCE
ncbi:hypothetical protein DFH08DRAFT_635102, partial [Mycena albidolilacea]